MTKCPVCGVVSDGMVLHEGNHAVVPAPSESEQEADLDRACKNATERMEAIRAKKPAPAASKEKEQRTLTIPELARVQDWLLRYVKEQDREDVKALCYMATLGAIKLDAVPSASAPQWQGIMLDLIQLAEVSMREANRDGGEYEIEEELRPARDLLRRVSSSAKRDSE